MQVAWVEQDETGRFVVRRRDMEKLGDTLNITMPNGKLVIFVYSSDGESTVDDAGVLVNVAHAIDPKATIPELLVS